MDGNRMGRLHTSPLEMTLAKHRRARWGLVCLALQNPKIGTSLLQDPPVLNSANAKWGWGVGENLV